MTNTRNIPTQAMELDYPLRMWRYELRFSSGAGTHPGGVGLIREVEVLADCTLTCAVRTPGTLAVGALQWPSRGSGAQCLTPG